MACWWWGSKSIIGVNGKMNVARYLLVGSFLFLSACDFQPPKTASVGGYELQLSTDPAPLKLGQNAAVSLLLRDGLNQPVADCNVRFRQHMPGHEMSLDDTFVLMTDPVKVGKYQGQSSEFRMGGDWVLEVEFVCGAESHTVAFDYRLEWPE
jgi:YtkA-like